MILLRLVPADSIDALLNLRLSVNATIRVRVLTPLGEPNSIDDKLLPLATVPRTPPRCAEPLIPLPTSLEALSMNVILTPVPLLEAAALEIAPFPIPRSRAQELPRSAVVELILLPETDPRTPGALSPIPPAMIYPLRVDPLDVMSMAIHWPLAVALTRGAVLHLL